MTGERTNERRAAGVCAAAVSQLASHPASNAANHRDSAWLTIAITVAVAAAASSSDRGGGVAAAAAVLVETSQ